ncbi:unnamed protein product [Didymodactylos carnosus]|uniref:Uncharacterized protein n=1 Tax=Didymodactylos carnosus TaxID=1234261 RepID=A0A815NFY8_9BILA|nr:unnamed protein product [Didymodactylos carnosus]CAF1432660.1 unnamed protein product [Didymodactylos carnosus]CAF3859307.1 unnamed protein product [Didymodactylos carnosus]CAF4310892.1 unnamed protein product [Didymodactylos carnosus]
MANVYHQRLIKNGSTTVSKKLSRSVSVEFDNSFYPDNQPSAITITAPQRKKLVKYPSDPNLFSNSGEHIQDEASPRTTTTSSLNRAQSSITFNFPTATHLTLSSSVLDTTPPPKPSTSSADLNESLTTIKIVEKHFGQPKETARAKKHLLSRPHGAIVTDVDEYALSVIRKKKAAKENKTGTTMNKTASKLRKQKPSTNTLDTLVSDHFNDVDAPPTHNRLQLTPPISSNSQPSNDFSTVTSSYPILQVLQSLQNATTTTRQQCQQCHRTIQPMDLTGNCIQCNTVLC